MAIKNIAGQPVRGENFFERPALVREFQQKISRGGSFNSPLLKMWWWKNVAC
ncbi:MAG: hypothetical protein NT166_29770 [Candidatus Aminicenantes bacterium]|nr:hypothetical protein [Candidatus Aminicenantes bacterium]